jgi:hypothetical protein
VFNVVAGERVFADLGMDKGLRAGGPIAQRQPSRERLGRRYREPAEALHISIPVPISKWKPGRPVSDLSKFFYTTMAGLVPRLRR